MRSKAPFCSYRFMILFKSIKYAWETGLLACYVFYIGYVKGVLILLHALVLALFVLTRAVFLLFRRVRVIFGLSKAFLTRMSRAEAVFEIGEILISTYIVSKTWALKAWFPRSQEQQNKSHHKGSLFPSAACFRLLKKTSCKSWKGPYRLLKRNKTRKKGLAIQKKRNLLINM